MYHPKLQTLYHSELLVFFLYKACNSVHQYVLQLLLLKSVSNILHITIIGKKHPKHSETDKKLFIVGSADTTTCYVGSADQTCYINITK